MDAAIFLTAATLMKFPTRRNVNRARQFLDFHSEAAFRDGF